MLHDPQHYYDLWRQFRHRMATSYNFRMWIPASNPDFMTVADWDEFGWGLFHNFFGDDVHLAGYVGVGTPWTRMVFVELDDEHNQPASLPEFKELAGLAGSFLPESVRVGLGDVVAFSGNPWNDWLSLMLLCVLPKEAENLIANPTKFNEFTLTFRPFYDSARTIECCNLAEDSPSVPLIADSAFAVKTDVLDSNCPERRGDSGTMSETAAGALVKVIDELELFCRDRDERTEGEKHYPHYLSDDELSRFDELDGRVYGLSEKLRFQLESAPEDPRVRRHRRGRTLIWIGEGSEGKYFRLTKKWLQTIRSLRAAAQALTELEDGDSGGDPGGGERPNKDGANLVATPPAVAEDKLTKTLEETGAGKTARRPGRPPVNKDRDEAILNLHVNTYEGWEVVDKLNSQWPELTAGSVRAVRSPPAASPSEPSSTEGGKVASHSENWVRVCRSTPCPVCGKSDNCSVSRDGGAVWCGRVDEGSARSNAGGQYLHILYENRPPPAGHQKRSSRSKGKKKEAANFQPLVESCFANPSAEAKRLDLAKRLAAPVALAYAAALRRLLVGWHEKQRWWSFPERDASGRFIGINRRYLNGEKRRIQGGSCGLSFCDDWDKALGPIILVEGGSDVATMLTMGLAVVGRPSNVGGIVLLCELLASINGDRDIVVIGEKDKKDRSAIKNHRPDCECCNQCWPGKYGAVRTATQLAEQLGRPVNWSFPPGEAKDVREWLLQQA